MLTGSIALRTSLEVERGVFPPRSRRQLDRLSIARSLPPPLVAGGSCPAVLVSAVFFFGLATVRPSLKAPSALPPRHHRIYGAAITSFLVWFCHAIPSFFSWCGFYKFFFRGTAPPRPSRRYLRSATPYPHELRGSASIFRSVFVGGIVCNGSFSLFLTRPSCGQSS